MRGIVGLLGGVLNSALVAVGEGIGEEGLGGGGSWDIYDGGRGVVG